VRLSDRLTARSGSHYVPGIQALAVDGGTRWFSELLHDDRGALATTDPW
jgi:hypothetical protein